MAANGREKEKFVVTLFSDENPSLTLLYSSKH
jgi:hypothetical protein